MGKIGLAVVSPAPLITPNYVVNFAKKCEAMGADSMWTIDRIAYDNLEPSMWADAPNIKVSLI